MRADQGADILGPSPAWFVDGAAVSPTTWTISNLPLGNSRVSSGESNRRVIASSAIEQNDKLNAHP